MSHCFIMGLTGLLIKEVVAGKNFDQGTDALKSYLGYSGVSDFTVEKLLKDFLNTVETVARELDWFEADSLKVSEELNNYLLDINNRLRDGDKIAIHAISMEICKYGNRTMREPFNNSTGAQALINTAKNVLDKYLVTDELLDLITIQDKALLIAGAGLVEDVIKVLSSLDVYVTSHSGVVAGLQEYAPTSYDHIETFPVEDWDVAGMECGGNSDCGCGCVEEQKIEHSLTVLQGIEDFLNGTVSKERHYFEGTAIANGIRLEGYAGQEGPIFDAIKNLAATAWKSVNDAWMAIRDWFTGDEDEETNKAILATADDNKKAIQSIADKAAQINDKAKAGIQALAKKVDVTGAMSGVVAKLGSPNSAGGVIDGLMGLLNKSTGPGSDLATEQKKTEAALADLKKASTSINGDDANKEAAAATKTDVGIKIKAAKAALNEAKKKVKDHNRITTGIRKAIAGITPHIFVSPQSGADANADNNKGKK